MTDLQRIKEMFIKAGIVFTEKPSAHLKGCTELAMEAKDGEFNEGYDGFVATMNFDSEGNLKTVGSWE